MSSRARAPIVVREAGDIAGDDVTQDQRLHSGLGRDAAHLFDLYSARHGLSTQVPVGPDEGLKHESALHCDELVSLPKVALRDFIGTLSPAKLRELDRALIAAVGIEFE